MPGGGGIAPAAVHLAGHCHGRVRASSKGIARLAAGPAGYYRGEVRFARHCLSGVLAGSKGIARFAVVSRAGYYLGTTSVQPAAAALR